MSKNRVVVPTPFDEPEQRKKTRKAPAVVPVVPAVDRDERRTRILDLPDAPVCALCGDPGAGSEYRGKLYHMTCKMEVKGR